MTREEYKSKVAELASQACTLRAKLEELSDECHEEWCNSDHFTDDEGFWYERTCFLQDLVANVSEVESELDEETQKIKIFPQLDNFSLLH